MSESINLVQGENKVSLARRNRTLILRIISLVFLASVALFSIILFFINNRLSVEDVKKQESITLQKIAQISDRNAKYALLNDRLKGINTILNSRKNYAVFLNAVSGTVPDGAFLTMLTVDKDGLLLTVSSSSLLSINTFLNNIVSQSLNKHLIKDIVIQGLTIDRDNGIYSLSIKAKPI